MRATARPCTPRYGDDMTDQTNWKEYYNALADDYVVALEGPYDEYRHAVVRSRLPEDLLQPGKAIFDYGCGNAKSFEWFLPHGCTVNGVDISEEMVKAAHQRLGTDETVEVGDLSSLEKIETASLDCLLSMNVIAYLDIEEKARFFSEARRIVKPDGYLLISHRNRLFDMFTLNSHTVEFFREFLCDQPVDGLLSRPAEPKIALHHKMHLNPLNYAAYLSQFSFTQLDLEVMHPHAAPPLMGGKGQHLHPDEIEKDPVTDWTRLFTNSMLVVLSRRIADQGAAE